MKAINTALFVVLLLILSGGCDESEELDSGSNLHCKDSELCYLDTYSHSSGSDDSQSEYRRLTSDTPNSTETTVVHVSNDSDGTDNVADTRDTSSQTGVGYETDTGKDTITSESTTDTYTETTTSGMQDTYADSETTKEDTQTTEDTDTKKPTCPPQGKCIDNNLFGTQGVYCDTFLGLFFSCELPNQSCCL